MESLFDVGDDPAVAETVARCFMSIANAMAGKGGDAELDAAAVAVQGLPDLPITGFLASMIIFVRLRSARQPHDLRHLDALLEIADRHPPPVPDWPRIRALARGMATMRAGAEGEIVDVREGFEALDALQAMAGDNPQHQATLRAARAGLERMRAYVEGDHAAMDRATAEVERLRHEGAGGTAAPILAALASTLDVMAANDRGDHERVRDGMEALRRFTQDGTAAGQHPAWQQLRGDVDEAATLLDALLPLMAEPAPGEPAPAPTSEQLAALRELADRPGASGSLRSLRQGLAGMVRIAAGIETDPEQVAGGVEELRNAVAGISPQDPRRPLLLQGLGLGLMERAEVTGDGADLAEAERLVTEARELAGGPESPQWTLINATLEQIHRRRGQPVRSRRVALEGLRGQAWNVLLQTDAVAAAHAARTAAEIALEVARWCLLDGEPGDAVQALDAGRALVLFSAVEFRDPPTRLAEAGRPDLAHRWREATRPDRPGAAPIELRREVLKALSVAPAGGGPAAFLDPPGLPEIRSALAALDADALVYLVPGKPAVLGWAVIVPVDAACRYLPLAQLTPDGDVDIEQYLAAVSRRDAAPAAAPDAGPDAPSGRDADVQAAESRFLGQLDTLCDWAWRAAIGPVLEQCPGAGPRAGGRPPRLVLVPVGNLARIPWHAARREDGTYAIELAAFSQAASARMLCDSAKWTPVPPTPLGLVVADPDTGGEASALLAAREEAYAIRQVFYPGARYIGRRPDGSPSRSGTGTDAEVRDWLGGTRPGAGAMLHLACHGVVRADPDDTTSYLLLADGSRLTAEELAGVLARSPGRAIGLVVLAACRTGVSHRGYDEAYSLGTAFLASGVRSVLSTQWSILDPDTSVLMFMFHHYVMAEHQPVPLALRQAQLWMLDPHRQVPERMPPALRRQLADTDPARVVAWAGFVHWGQ